MKASLSRLHDATCKHVAFWIATLTMASLAFGQSPKISPDLQALNPNTNVSVIVQYSTPPSGRELNAANAATAANGKALGLANAYVWTTSPAKIQNLLNQDPNVKYVSPDRPLRGAMNYADPAVNADVAHNLGYDGTGIGVAVIDSGVNQVFDLTQSGASIVLITDELLELIGLSHRIAIMRGGRLSEILDAPPDRKPSERELVGHMLSA